MKETFGFDAIVIGAGVVGLAIASELCKFFEKVIIIEKETDFGQHVSSRHSGVIHSGIYYDPGSLKAELCVEGNKLLYAFAEKHSIKHLNCGKLVVGHDEKDCSKLESLQKNGQRNGVLNLELLSSHDALKIQPNLKCEKALWVPSTGIIDSHGLMYTLERKILDQGGIVYYNSEVKDIRKEKGNYELLLKNSDEILKSSIIINSAGLWSDSISNMLGVNKYKIHYCKGDYYKSKKFNDLKCLVYPLPGKTGLGIHTVLQLDGSVSFGPNAYYVDKIDYNIDDKYLDVFSDSINEFFDIRKEDLSVDYSGIRPKPFGINEAPLDFIIKEEKEFGFNNFINLIGIESPGLTSSLAIARYVASMVKEFN